jgi:hypothetical protein
MPISIKLAPVFAAAGRYPAVVTAGIASVFGLWAACSAGQLFDAGAPAP